MPLDRTLRTTFDRIAKLYDEVRPGYPEALIEDIITLSKIPPGGRILEVGCGPGKATLPFAKRGYAMLCLELGRELSALATENCAPYPDVQIQNTAFEDWILESKAFDLFISAEAFHWIPPEIGYPKAAAALKDTGSIAVFWHYTYNEGLSIFDNIEKVYEQRAPQLVKGRPGSISIEGRIKNTIEDINTSKAFGKVTVKRYTRSRNYTAEQYTRLISTHSRIQNLEEEQRRHLLEGIKEVIEDFGGTIEQQENTLLYFARIKRHL